MRLIFTHSQANPPIHQWIRQSKHLLQRNEKAKTIGNGIQVASRQPKNLQQLVGGYGGSGGCGYANFSVTIIEQVRLKTMDFLAKRETFWQHQLRVYIENGGIGHCYRKDI